MTKKQSLILLTSLLSLVSPQWSQAQEREVVADRTEPTATDGEPLPELERIDSLIEEEAEAGYIFDRFPPVLATHFAHSIASIVGDNVEIEDGSIWKASYYDSYKTKNWRAEDLVRITQNNSWFSTHKYRIVNVTSGGTAEADLVLGPVVNGAYTRYINDINLTTGYLILNDSTQWEISSYDQSTLRNWQINDPIIIGYNSSWDSRCEALLIDVSTNTAVRANQL